MKKLLSASVTALAMLAIATTGAFAGDDDDDDHGVHKVKLYTYVAKALCGKAAGSPLVVDGNYKTSVNLLNPTGGDITGSVTFYLSGTDSGDVPATVGPEIKTLPAGVAFAAPCPPEIGLPNDFRDGFASASTCDKGLVVKVIHSWVTEQLGNAGNVQVSTIEPSVSRIDPANCPVAVP